MMMTIPILIIVILSKYECLNGIVSFEIIKYVC